MTQAHSALTRRLLALTDPANLRPVKDPESADAVHQGRTREQIAHLLAQAVAGGLRDRRGTVLALGSPDSGERLRACQAVAAHLGEGEAGPLAVDWLIYRQPCTEEQAPGLIDVAG